MGNALLGTNGERGEKQEGSLRGRQPKTQRNTRMRNLNNLGCSLDEIAKGFGMSAASVLKIVERRTKVNPCPKHRNVCARCPDCKRVAVKAPKELGRVRIEDYLP